MKFYILSLKWSYGKEKYVWWGPDNSGYTENINEAGVYTEEKINSNPGYYRNTSTYPVPVEVVEKMTMHRVVPTLSENWNVMDIDLPALKEY